MDYFMNENINISFYLDNNSIIPYLSNASLIWPRVSYRKNKIKGIRRFFLNHKREPFENFQSARKDLALLNSLKI